MGAPSAPLPRLTRASVLVPVRLHSVNWRRTDPKGRKAVTDLPRFQDAYATLTVAAYEPLILRWVSGWTLLTLAGELVWRGKPAAGAQAQLSTAVALNLAHGDRKKPALGELGNLKTRPRAAFVRAVDLSGRAIADQDVRPVEIEGWPNAVMVGERLYPNGVLTVRSEPDEERTHISGRFPAGENVHEPASARSAMGVR